MVRTLCILLLLTLLVYSGVWLFYDGMQDTLTSLIPETEAKVQNGEPVLLPESETGESGVPDYGIIVSRNIFQAVDSGSGEAVPEVIDEEDLEETRLQLVLLGTVTGTENDARAIIVDKKDRKQNLYRIGDFVQKGKIRKISRGRVVLEVNGRNEILLIKDREGGGPGSIQIPSPEKQASLGGTSVKPSPAPVVRPRRRISLRQPRQVEPVQVAEPEQPLAEEQLGDQSVVGGEESEENIDEELNPDEEKSETY